MTYLLNRDYFHEVSKGNVVNATRINKFGENLDVDTESAETIWAPGGLWVPTTADRIMDISSSNGNDTLAGNGCQQVLVTGISGGNITSELVDMNGTTDVQTVNSYSTIHRILNVSAGSNGVNVGDITATAQVDGTVQAFVPSAVGVTQQLFVECPVGYNMHILGGRFNAYKQSGGGTPVVDIEGWIISDTGAEFRIFRETVDTSLSNDTGDLIQQRITTPFPAGYRGEVRAVTDSINTAVQGRVWVIFEQA